MKGRRHSFDIKGGLRDLGGFVESGDFALRYNHYKVREFEFESDENVTELESLATNENFNYRVTLNQSDAGDFLEPSVCQASPETLFPSAKKRLHRAQNSIRSRSMRWSDSIWKRSDFSSAVELNRTVTIRKEIFVTETLSASQEA